MTRYELDQEHTRGSLDVHRDTDDGAIILHACMKAERMSFFCLLLAKLSPLGGFASSTNFRAICEGRSPSANEQQVNCAMMEKTAEAQTCTANFSGSFCKACFPDETAKSAYGHVQASCLHSFMHMQPVSDTILLIV